MDSIVSFVVSEMPLLLTNAGIRENFRVPDLEGQIELPGGRLSSQRHVTPGKVQDSKVVGAKRPPKGKSSTDLFCLERK